MKVVALLSMLHEPADAHSAARRFRGEPVLAWTLRRLSRARGVDATSILCWDDQADAAGSVARAAGTTLQPKGPRARIPAIEAVSAARRWADGWRGGLGGACDCDRGFYGPFALDALRDAGADAALLVDPAAGLIDPELLSALIGHAAGRGHVEICFSQAAPGLSGVLVRGGMLAQLAAAKLHPGAMLSYRPDHARKDPIGTDACVAVPAPLARTTRRFTLDSSTQVDRLTTATAQLNGTLISASATGLNDALDASPQTPPPLREVVLELNTERATQPIYWPGRHAPIVRPALALDRAERLFDELAGDEELRLTFAGVGDPLLHPQFAEIVGEARARGLRRIAVETDLLPARRDVIDALPGLGIDVVSAHVPAVSAKTYAAVMGTDALAPAFENLRALLLARGAAGAGTPLVVPTFTKCAANLHEMEAWYDHWMRALGAAVIVGPSTFGGLVPDAGVAVMTPPRRLPCARLASRLTVLCDGSIVSCEEDVVRPRPIGNIAVDRVRDVWNAGFGALRQAHQSGNWARLGQCANCTEWHRA